MKTRFEAKASAKYHLYINWIKSREIEILNGFKHYSKRRIVLTKKLKKPGVCGRRGPREYFKLVPEDFWNKLKERTILCHYKKGCSELPITTLHSKWGRELD